MKPLEFLPLTGPEIIRAGWTQPDIIIVTPEAYIDHPAFAPAILGRFLEAAGFKVAVLSRPDTTKTDSFKVLGMPRLFWAVSGGSLDWQIFRQTPAGAPRKNDNYWPELWQEQPDQPVRPVSPLKTYCHKIRESFSDQTIIIGGLEASLRRFSHYDYLKNRICSSILLDSKADYLGWGPGEKTLLELARHISDRGPSVKPALIEGTMIRLPGNKAEAAPILEQIRQRWSAPVNLGNFTPDKQLRRDFLKLFFTESRADFPRPLLENYSTASICQLPHFNWETEDLDRIYSLPFSRLPHPDYATGGPLKAWEMIKSSITAHRGCGGGCNFCAITAHQGKAVISRSIQSIADEVIRVAQLKFCHGSISDVGGPTANLYGTWCQRKSPQFRCRRSSCLVPEICTSLKGLNNFYRLLEALRKLKRRPEVSNLFISSGLRHDLFKTSAELNQLDGFIPGRLKIAPEHFSDEVLKKMNKPELKSFLYFLRLLKNSKLSLRFYVAYLMVGHIGETEADFDLLQQGISRYLKFKPEQVQQFTPLPLTPSGGCACCGTDLFTGTLVETVPTAVAARRKLMVTTNLTSKSSPRPRLNARRRTRFKPGR